MERYLDYAMRAYHAAIASADPDQMELTAQRLRDAADRQDSQTASALLNLAARLWDEAIILAVC